MKLTEKNYFTKDNKYLSNSKITSFLRDTETFEKLYIKYTEVFETTPSIEVGKAVDIYLTDSADAFKKLYTKAVLKKDDPELFEENKTTDKTVLTKATYDKVMTMAKYVKRTKAYKELKEYKTQEILSMDIKKHKRFKGLCGIPDFFEIKGDTCTIVDLKTSNVITDKKYFYHCIDYGYFSQLAMYSILIMNKYPKVRKFNYRHLVVENVKPYRTRTFHLDGNIVKAAVNQVMVIADYINAAKTFKRPDTTWENATLITYPDYGNNNIEQNKGVKSESKPEAKDKKVPKSGEPNTPNDGKKGKL